MHKNWFWLSMRVTLLATAILMIIGRSCVFAADIWYEDNNLGKAGGVPTDFITKFYHPESFAKATAFINVYMIRANVLTSLDDDFIKTVFSAYLCKNNIKLAIDAGGATWMQQPGRSKATTRDFEQLRRIKRLGVSVNYISLQSVLSKVQRKHGVKIVYPLQKRITDVVTYAKTVTQIYPDVEIGIIDALPSHGKGYRDAYRQLTETLSDVGLKLSYIHLDMPFEIPKNRINGTSWAKTRDIERYVERELGVNFGYYITSREGGVKSGRAFHKNVISDLECYAGSGGTPRDFVIASWFPYPDKTIPDTPVGDRYPVMRTVLNLGQKLDEIEKGRPTWLDYIHSSAWRMQCGL